MSVLIGHFSTMTTATLVQPNSTNTYDLDEKGIYSCRVYIIHSWQFLLSGPSSHPGDGDIHLSMFDTPK